MRELSDYSGPFIKDLKMEDFSRDALVRAWYAASKLYVGIDGLWNTLLRKRYGQETAWELEKELWWEAQILEAKRVIEAMNISGKDVEALFKFYQVDPGMAGVMDLDMQLFSNTHGILTVKQCLCLGYFERHGDDALQKLVCETIDGARGFPIVGRFFNPKMTCKNLKLPPRKSKDEIACRWEFKIEG